MSALPQPRYTLEEYFALELASDARFEYWDGHVFELSGGSHDHETIIGNIFAHLKNVLRGRDCRAFLSNLRIKVPAYLPYRYADLAALWGPPSYENIGGIDALTNPSLLAEVLSPSTEAFDRGDKFSYYKSIESFREYLLVAQRRPHITQLIRQDNGDWLQREVNDLAGVIHLETLGCDLPLAEVYLDIDFPPVSPPFPVIA
jgi:Uma2 family endonuclease